MRVCFKNKIIAQNCHCGSEPVMEKNQNHFFFLPRLAEEAAGSSASSAGGALRFFFFFGGSAAGSSVCCSTVLFLSATLALAVGLLPLASAFAPAFATDVFLTFTALGGGKTKRKKKQLRSILYIVFLHSLLKSQMLGSCQQIVAGHIDLGALDEQGTHFLLCLTEQVDCKLKDLAWWIDD